MTATLLTIPSSHYCEKARWALECCGVPYREDGHLPLIHWLAVRRVGGGRTVPVVVDGQTLLTDSTDIIAWADAQRPGTLLPAEPALRAAALEDELDVNLGPATRRWGYYYTLPRRDLTHLMVRGAPAWEARALRWSRPLAERFLARGLRIDAAGVARSRAKIEATFARIEALLADGRRYLVGDRFSVADLTFAALASPILLPAEHPFLVPRLDDLRPEPRAQVDAWRASPAGQLALGLYADHRAA
jgi:glutathione S-transferase